MGPPYTSERDHKELKSDLRKVFANHYVMSAQLDVAFEIGRLHMAMEDYNDALEVSDFTAT